MDVEPLNRGFANEQYLSDLNRVGLSGGFCLPFD
jgi:hypothetical protein